MAETARRSGTAPEAAVGAFVIAAALPLTRLFSPDGPVPTVVIALAMSLGLAYALRRGNVGLLTSWFITSLSMIWFASVVFVPDTLWIYFPSGRSLQGLVDGLAGAKQIIIDETAPLRPVPEMMLVVAAGIWQTTWLVHTALIRLRSPLLAASCAIPLFALPGMFLPSERRVLEIVLFLAGAAWLLFEEERARTEVKTAVGTGAARIGWGAGPAVRLAGAAAVVAALLAPMLPGFALPPGPADGPSGSSRVFFNPLVAVRPTLDNDREVVLFTVKADRQTYYRLTSLNHFDGKVWTQRGRRPLPDDSPLVRIPRTRTTRVTQSFQIENLGGPWVPAAFRAVGTVPGARWEAESATMLLEEGLPRQFSYEVVSVVPRPTAEELDAQGSDYPGGIGPYLDLPRSLPSAVRRYARDVAGDERTPYRRALALQEHLRSFTYDENVAEGHGFDTLVEFLTETKRGYCEQFAAAMAVLARTLDIPSRVVIGFGHGREIAEDTYRITTRQAHSWVELYFPRAGWVPFEPTPRAGVTTAPDYAPPEQGDEPGATPTATPTTAPTTEPSASARPTNAPRNEPGFSDVPEPGLPPLVRFALGLAVAAMVALATAVASRLLIKWRLDHAPSAREAIALAYRDFLGWCAASGIPKRPGETPAEHARRVAAVAPDAREAVTTLADDVSEALWAPPNGYDPDAVSRLGVEARRAVVGSLKPHRRALAHLGWGRWRTT